MRALPAASRLSTGFTLIEILVVIVILAVAAAMVTLAVSGVGERRLARDSERLRALIGYACEQAELEGRSIGISLSRSGYAFSRAEGGSWLPEREGTLRTRKWSVAPTAVLTRDGEPVAIGEAYPAKPQLVCFASGELTAFRLELGLPDSTSRRRIDGRGDGELEERSVDAPAP